MALDTGGFSPVSSALLLHRSHGALPAVDGRLELVPAKPKKKGNKGGGGRHKNERKRRRDNAVCISESSPT